jgi:UDP-N-acetylmuramyl tripeptide synthase
VKEEARERRRKKKKHQPKQKQKQKAADGDTDTGTVEETKREDLPGPGCHAGCNTVAAAGCAKKTKKGTQKPLLCI